MRTEQRQKIPILQNQVVVFSKNYLPLARINLKRVFTLFQGNCCAPHRVLDLQVVADERSPHFLSSLGANLVGESDTSIF